MKKIIKIVMTLIVFILISVQYNNTVYADGAGEGNAKSATWTTQSPSWWKPTDVDVGQSEMIDKAKIITTALRNIGIVVAVIALMVLGFRQMTASAEQKSIIKESLPGYLIGVVMVITLTVLPSIIYELTKQLSLI